MLSQTKAILYIYLCLFSSVFAAPVVEQGHANVERRGVASFPQGMKWSNRAWGAGRDGDSISGKDVVDVDLFDTNPSEIKGYQAQGKKVMCYVNVGASESWREDFKQNKAAFEKAKGKNLKGWKGEFWFDIVHKLPQVKAIVGKRFNLAKEKGCDAIEADNVDCYQNDCISGASDKVKKAAQIAYDKWQAEKVHSLGMAIGLKNSLDLIPELIDHYDFAMNEQCVEYGECRHLEAFSKQNKAVFGTEYGESESKIKAEAKKYGIVSKNEKG
eukprot:Awhi_evm1s841